MEIYFKIDNKKFKAFFPLNYISEIGPWKNLLLKMTPNVIFEGENIVT